MQISVSRNCLFLLALMTTLLADWVTVTAFAERPLPEVQRLQTSPVLQHLKPNPMSSPPRTPAEQTVAQMDLPEGFRAELVVGEPDLQQPVAFAFDERGRIWVLGGGSFGGSGELAAHLDEHLRGRSRFQRPGERRLFQSLLPRPSAVAVSMQYPENIPHAKSAKGAKANGVS